MNIFNHNYSTTVYDGLWAAICYQIMARHRTDNTNRAYAHSDSPGGRTDSTRPRTLYVLYILASVIFVNENGNFLKRKITISLSKTKK